MNTALFRPALTLAIAGCAVLFAACATSSSTPTPLNPVAPEAMSVDDEIHHRLGRSQSLNPADGAPYRAYQLTLNAGDVLRIAVESSQITPRLTLYGPDGSVVASTNQQNTAQAYATYHGGYQAGYGQTGGYGATAMPQNTSGQISLISETTDDGPHILVVASQNRHDLGTYRITSERLEGSEDLSFPGRITGYLLDGTGRHPQSGAPRNSYPLSLDEAQAIEFRLHSNDFVPLLSVVDSDTDEVLLTQQANGPQQAQVRAELPAGDYEVWTSSGQAGVNGRYTLRLEHTEIVRSEEFLLGERYQGFLGWDREPVTNSYRTGQPLSFEVEETGVIDALLNSPDFDSILVLTDATGQVVHEDHQSGMHMPQHANQYTYSGGQYFNPARIIWPVEPGEYTLWATSTTEQGLGAFTVEAHFEALPESPELTLGSTVKGALTQNSEYHAQRYTQFEYFPLTIDEDQQVTIGVSDVAFDYRLLILDENGEVIDETQYDHSGQLQRSLTVDLEAGTYQVGVTNGGGMTFGTFQLRAQAADNDQAGADEE